MKSRGHRIELGEVEAATNALESVREGAVVGVASGDFEGTAICCALVPEDSSVTTSAVVRTALRKVLPSYMVPSRWLVLPALPTNANGKIDRRRLRELFLEMDVPALRRGSPAPGRIGMTEPLLAELAGIFAEVTGLEPPHPDTDLIEGGVLDSLALVELLFAIEQELGVVIPAELLDVTRFRTLASLAELVAECRALGTSDAA